MAKATAAKSKKPVLVTTEFRGVFFGYIKEDKKAPEQITLTGVRNCLFWSANVGGFLGLAANGPNRDCKIGVRVDEVTLYKITSVTEVTDQAAKAWDAV